MEVQRSREDPLGEAKILKMYYTRGERTYWCSDDPIDVSDVENLTEYSADPRIRAPELNWNGSIAQVGSHGKVRNGGSHSNGCSNVMKNTITSGNRKAVANECNSCDSLLTLDLIKEKKQLYAPS